MASTFFGLDIAYTGVQAANAKVNTTANNIANVETKGYSRQEANQVASDALRVSQTYGMAGTGVTTKDITQVRNQYYDVKYWESQTNLGEYETKKYYMYQVEDYFTDKDTVEGFEPLYAGMFNSLEEVYKMAGTDVTKTQFLGAAGDLCEYFNAQATNLEKLQLGVNEEIKNKVNEINAIAEQIATLNKQINTIEVQKMHANELRDKRALLVDQLSKVVDVTVRETPIYTTPGGTQKSGIFTYEVCIAGGQTLVQGYEYNTLKCTARADDEKINQSDAQGLYDISWSNGLDFSLYGANLGGELKGLIEMRDGNNEEYFNGTIKNVSEAPADAEDYDYVVKIEVANKDYLTDMTKCTLPENGMLSLVNSKYKYTEWTFDANTNEYTFKIKKDDSMPDPTIYDGREASVGEKLDYQGIPYYQQQMNEWIRITAKAMNTIEKGAMDNYGKAAEALFTANNAQDKTDPYKFTDSAANDAAKIYSSTSDDYYKLTAKSFQVNQDMIKDVNKLGTTYDIKQGGDAQDITEKLLEVQNAKTVKVGNKEIQTAFRGCTSKEFLQCLTSDIALSANNAKTFTENYENINKAVSQQRLSISGVDNDEEALNLVKFQEAYNLSAKVMQIMTEIYDRLILQTGV